MLQMQHITSFLLKFKSNLLVKRSFLFNVAFAMAILYTGCPRKKVPDFGRVFLMLKYTEITRNTYVQI